MPKKARKATRAKKAKAPQRNPFRFASSKARKKNPSRRRNPSRGLGLVSTTTDFAKSGAFALVGLVIARQVPQMLLGSRNQDWMGYAANFTTTVAASYAASRFVGKDAGRYIFIGGAVYTVSRILLEKFNPFGRYLTLTGVGDPQAVGLQGIQEGYFPVPVVYDKDGKAIVPVAITDAARREAETVVQQQQQQAQAAGMSGSRRGRW